MRRNRRLGGDDAVGDSNTSLMDTLGNGLGAVLFLLIIMMMVMVLLPKALASLRELQILDNGQEVVELPSATLGEAYQAYFASEGGEEFVSFELAAGQLPPGLDWLTVTHGNSGLTEQTAPEHHYASQVGLHGIPSGEAKRYEFTLVARSAMPLDKSRREDFEKPENKAFLTSEPQRFRLSVVYPPVQRVNQVADLQITSDERLPETRLASASGSKQLTATTQIFVRGGVQPYEWSVAVDSLKAAQADGTPTLTIDANGQVKLQGAGPVEAAFSVTVRSAQADVLGRQGKKVEATKKFVWRVLPIYQPLEMAMPARLSPIVVESNFDIPMAARGGSGAYVWKLRSKDDEALTWLTLDTRQGSRLVGRASMAELGKESYLRDYKLTVELSDGTPGSSPLVKELILPVMAKAKTFEHEGDPASVVKITTAPELPVAVSGINYQVSLAAQGGRPPYHWELSKVEFRDINSSDFVMVDATKLSIDNSAYGVLKITPRRPGETRLQVKVRDSNADGSPGATSDETQLKLAIKSFNSLDDAPPLQILTPPSLPDAVEEQEYQVAFSAVGGVPPYQWSVQGAAPAGFRFRDPVKGIFAGKPSAQAAGQHTFDVLLTDQQGSDHLRTLKLTLNVRPAAKPLQIVTSRLPSAALQQPYEALLAASGGQPPLAWSITRGTLPDGMLLDPDSGRVWGSPKQLSRQPTTLGVEVRQSDGKKASADVTLEVLAAISPKPLQILTSELLPPAVAGRPYEVQLAVAGGVPPFRWDKGVTWPDLTAGRVTISESGKLVNPLFPAKRTILLEAQVTDALGASAKQNFRLPVLEEGALPPTPPKLTIRLPDMLPDARADHDYAVALAAEGGMAPYHWSIEGDLPQGLRLENGLIVGKATGEQKPLTVKVVVSDAQNPVDTDHKQVTFGTLAPRSSWLDWWRYFVFAGLVISFFVCVLISEGRFERLQQRLVGNGLVIVTNTSGRQLSGPQHVLDQYFANRKVFDAYMLLIAVGHLLLGVGFGVYLYFFT